MGEHLVRAIHSPRGRRAMTGIMKEFLSNRRDYDAGAQWLHMLRRGCPRRSLRRAPFVPAKEDARLRGLVSKRQKSTYGEDWE